jgi:hypothetical protein
VNHLKDSASEMGANSSKQLRVPKLPKPIEVNEALKSIPTPAESLIVGLKR